MAARTFLAKKKPAKARRPPSISAPQRSAREAAVPRSARLGGVYRGAPAQALHPAPAVQMRLTVGKADDPYETEADAVAESVMSGAEVPSVTPLEGDEVRTEAAGTPAPTPPPVVARAVADPGPGEPLRPTLRNSVEPRLGLDLASVRVHTGPEARSTARVLRARAFTHGRDIWLGPGESPTDGRLMAHELTHVAQQSEGSAPLPLIQRKPADYRHPEDGGGVSQRLDRRFDNEIDDPETSENPSAAARQADRSEMRSKKGELKGETKPDVDRPAAEQPRVERSADRVEQEADSPAEPLAEAEETPARSEGGGEGASSAGAAEQASNLAQQAFDAAQAQPMPQPEPEVAVPEPVVPVDAAGEMLAGDPATEDRVAELAGRAQLLREGAHHLRAKASEERGNAEILRGNLALVDGELAKAEEGITTSRDHASYRREVVAQAEEALAVSEQKAATVAEQAPQFADKADEGTQDAGPMAEEAGGLSEQNRANTPNDDPESAAKAREQGGKIDAVGHDSLTMDDAVSQTREKADSLGEDAARAAEKNTQTRAQIDEGTAKLDQTEERLGQMDQQTQQARSQSASMAGFSDAVRGRADAMDEQAQALNAASHELEARLAGVQKSYEQGMKSVPKLEPWEEEGGEEGAEEGVVQLLPEPGRDGSGSDGGDAGYGFTDALAETLLAPEEGRYDEREKIDATGELPPWLTGVDPVSAEQREAARQQEEERRRNEVTQIDQSAGGRFEDLGAADKMGVALRLVGQNYYNAIANIKWPGWGELAKALFDPRSMLTGVTGGLSMMLSGAANLFSAEQWSSDPLGNLLKSAADIASGLTIVLGSITALAGLVAATMGALILVTFGAFSPIGVPVISVCTTIITTVGGWTIAVGKVALVLQALSLIKNLIDAATAETAEDLQNQSDQMRQDINGAGQVVMQIIGAKGAQAGIGRLQSRVGAFQSRVLAAGGPRAFARAAVRAAPGRLASGARATGGGIYRGIRSAGSRVASSAQRGWTTARSAFQRGRGWLRDRFRRRKPTPDGPLDPGLSNRGYRPRPGERSLTKRQWKQRERQRRAGKSVTALDEPLTPTKKGHTAKRHRAAKTNRQLRDRAVNKNIEAATRFANDSTHLRVVKTLQRRAMQAQAAGPPYPPGFQVIGGGKKLVFTRQPFSFRTGMGYYGKKAPPGAVIGDPTGPLKHATIVLQRTGFDAAGKPIYKVLTAYPTLP